MQPRNRATMQSRTNEFSNETQSRFHMATIEGYPAPARADAQFTRRLSVPMLVDEEANMLRHFPQYLEALDQITKMIPPHALDPRADFFTFIANMGFTEIDLVVHDNGFPSFEEYRRSGGRSRAFAAWLGFHVMPHALHLSFMDVDAVERSIRWEGYNECVLAKYMSSRPTIIDTIIHARMNQTRFPEDSYLLVALHRNIIPDPAIPELSPEAVRYVVVVVARTTNALDDPYSRFALYPIVTCGTYITCDTMGNVLSNAKTLAGAFWPAVHAAMTRFRVYDMHW